MQAFHSVFLGMEVLRKALPLLIRQDYPASSEIRPAAYGRWTYTGLTNKGHWVRQAIANHTGNLNLRFFANPNPVQGSGGAASTTLYWDLSKMQTVKAVEIHAGTVSGPLIAKGGATGNTRASIAARNAPDFVLVDATEGTHKLLGSHTADPDYSRRQRCLRPNRLHRPQNCQTDERQPIQGLSGCAPRADHHSRRAVQQRLSPICCHVAPLFGLAFALRLGPPITKGNELSRPQLLSRLWFNRRGRNLLADNGQTGDYLSDASAGGVTGTEATSFATSQVPIAQ